VKKKEIYFGKSLKRIYFTIAGLWLCIPLGVILTGNKAGLTMTQLVQMIALPLLSCSSVLSHCCRNPK